MSLNRRSNYRYYRPQNNSVSTNPNRNMPTQSISYFHMFLIFFIGFFLMYGGLIYSFGNGIEKEQSDAIALDATPTPITNQEAENKESIFAFFKPQGEANTLGLTTKQDEKLMKLIEEQIPKDNGEYAVVVKELTGEQKQVSINAQTIFPAGSLYKLYVMAAALEKIEKGELTMQTTISAEANHLEQVLDGPDFGYEDRKGETITYTVEQILGRIARISDNYASVMLAEKLDNWEYVRDYAKRIGASNTTIKSPISTNANDIANFFDLLYQKKIVSETSSNKIIELLKTAQLNQRIPAKLPKKGIEIAHKTGELPGVRHDAGIVYINSEDKESTSSAKTQKAYMIILMSKDLKGEDGGVETLADISKVVYDYLSSTK